MAYIDFEFINSGKYSQLSMSARVLYYVICGLEHYQTGVCQYKVDTLAKLAGISRSAAFNAMNELENKVNSMAKWNGQTKHDKRPNNALDMPIIRRAVINGKAVIINLLHPYQKGNSEVSQSNIQTGKSNIQTKKSNIQTDNESNNMSQHDLEG